MLAAWIMMAMAGAVEPALEGADAPAVETSGPAAGGEATAPAEPAAPVTRTYAMRQTFSSQMRNPNPFAGAEWKGTRTNTWALVKATWEGDRVRYTEDTCGVRTDPVFGAETVYTKAFIDGIEQRKRVAVVTGEGSARRFHAGPYAQAFGVQLDNPLTDPLPNTPDDPRIVDSDGDGKPGTTVVIRHSLFRGEVYIAQRSVARLVGKVLDDGSVRGIILTGPEMYKIGANNRFLRGETPQRQNPDSKESPFVMVPVPDTTTCTDILAKTEALFPSLVELGASAEAP